MNSLGAFCITKNEAHWIGFCIMSTKDFTEEYVYFDGNSTDGTVELLKHIRDKHGVPITIVEGQDPKDLQDDYVRVFNACLKTVKAKYAWFLHPDMICTKAPARPLSDELAAFVRIRSFAGDPFQPIVEFKEGRTDRWKSIMKNGLGLHYHGHYGVGNEDMYFKAITGEDHTLYEKLESYPYAIYDSGIELNHYSDVRAYGRRLGRMVTCLKNQFPGMQDEHAREMSRNHPRVCLEERPGFGKFVFQPAGPAPEVFRRYNAEFAAVCGKKPEEFSFLPLEEPVHA